MKNEKFVELVNSTKWMVAHKKGLNPNGGTITRIIEASSSKSQSTPPSAQMTPANAAPTTKD
ncbi:MAG: hypothetical protein ACJA1I_001077 [Zhongshania marina]|jgi:hypothetical protein